MDSRDGKLAGIRLSEQERFCVRNTGPFSFFLLALRATLGGIFLFAAYQKLGPDSVPDLKTTAAAVKTPVQDFAESIKAFKVVPDHMIPILTYAVPWTEAICGVLLIIGLRTRAASFILTAALGSFIWAIYRVVQRGEHVECGCFGKINFPCKAQITDGTCQIVRNSVLALMAVTLLLFGAGTLSFDGVFDKSRRRSKRSGPSRPLGKPVEKV